MRISSLLFAATLPACAHARDPGLFLDPGPLYAPSARPKGVPASIGGEISTVYYDKGCCTGWGPLVQGEWLPAGGERTSSSRFAVGLQGVDGPFGIDAGWAVRSSGGSHSPWATGPQLGAFFSVAQASIGVRTMLPIAHGASDGSEPGDVSMVITLKVPILIYGERPDFDPFPNMFRMPAGRPIAIDGETRVASVVRTSSWSV